MTNHQARTSPDTSDPRLRTRNYQQPYEVFFSAILALQAVLPRWQLIHYDRHAGSIYMERQTRMFRFVDDIQIHLTKKDNGGITLNLCSKSRVGKWDFGQNARNIREFLNALDQRLKKSG